LTVIAALVVALPLAGAAQSLNNVLDKQQDRTRLSQESQQRIDKVVEQTRSLEDVYKSVLKQIKGLEIYNTLLQRQTDNQKTQMGELRESIDQVEVINRQIVPIMTTMIDSLEQFVALDVPFLLEERTERVQNLKDLMERQDVNVAEKFRKVTEAYQIENDFGKTIEHYKDTLNINGATTVVDVLRVGRVALVYQTADGKTTGAWDKASGDWVELDKGDYKNQIKFGLRIAQKQVAPDLVMVPIDAPEAN